MRRASSFGRGSPMKKVIATVIALSAVVIATSAQAQQAPATPVPGSVSQPRKLFFEGDIVRHALPGQQGPFCVLANQVRRKEAIACRIRTLLPNGDVADDKVLKRLVVERGNAEKIAAGYGLHADAPSDA